MENPLKYFAELTDPRVERNREHVLEEILLIAVAAVLSGAESWNDMEEYGNAKLDWLQSFLRLPSGIPSHDTFNRVFAALDPDELERGFVAWVGSIARLTAGEVIAIDGKASCGTRAAGQKTVVHMVSAWANSNNLVLGQRKVDDKSNEITAIPKLLAALALQGTVVTIDGMGCQRAIARQIVEKKADYILAVKENQGHLFGRREGLVPNADGAGYRGTDRLWARARGTPPLRGGKRPHAFGPRPGVGLVTESGAHRGRALP